MGSYRLLLAVAVMLSHFGLPGLTINPGVVAVVSFFLLSGFVMTGLIRSHYMQLARVPAFYLDRAVRLYPQFLFYLAVCVVLHVAFGKYESGDLKLVSLNLLLVPLDFYHWLGYRMLFNLPTWSLGLEALFYLVFPFILLYRVRESVAAVSLAVFAYSVAGVLDNDLFGYRLLPGTLFVFMCGSWIYDGERKIPVLIWLGAAVLFALSLMNENFSASPNSDLALGLLIGIPAVWLLKGLKQTKIDTLAGNLSYGLFLSHYPVLVAFKHFSDDLQPVGLEMLWLSAISLWFAWLTFSYIERPALSIRKHLRIKLSPSRRSPARASRPLPQG